MVNRYINGKNSPTVGELIVLRKRRTEELEEILATSDAGRPLPRGKDRENNAPKKLFELWSARQVVCASTFPKLVSETL